MAAVRPASLTLVSPISVATIADAMCSMDVLALYVSVSCDLGRFRVTCHQLAYSDSPRLFFVMITFSCLCPLLIFGYDDSSLAWTSLRPYVTRTICLSPVPGSSYAQFSIWCFSLTQLDDIPVLYSYGLYASLYLYFLDLYIYWVGDGMLPIFNLLCNHPSVVT